MSFLRGAFGVGVVFVVGGGGGGRVVGGGEREREREFVCELYGKYKVCYVI